VCLCLHRARSRSTTPPAKRKRRFQSHSRSGSRESPAPVAKSTEVIPDVVKSCDVSGSEAKSHTRYNKSAQPLRGCPLWGHPCSVFTMGISHFPYELRFTYLSRYVKRSRHGTDRQTDGQDRYMMGPPSRKDDGPIIILFESGLGYCRQKPVSAIRVRFKPV